MKRFRRSGHSFSLVLIGGVCVLLPLLAFLQYRWIGEVSVAERQRLEEGLAVAVSRFGDDLRRELTGLAVNFQVQPSSEGLEIQLAQSFERWNGLSLYPGIFKAVYVAAADPAGELVTHRFDPESRTLQVAAWPQDLASLEIRFNPFQERSISVGRDFPIDNSRLGFTPAQSPSNSIWLVTPIVPIETIRAGSMPRSPWGWILIEMDMHSLATELLPDLVAFHFDDLDYKVAIFESARSDNVVLASEDGLSRQDIASPDVAIAAFPLMTTGRRNTHRLARDGRRGPPPNLIADGALLGPRRGPPRGTPGFTLIGATWELAVQHQMGSLAKAVSALRQRNLIVGLGILGLLGVSGAMTIVGAEKVRSIGRLQLEFAAGISHELRTPLTTIRTAARNLSAGVVTTPGEIREYAQLVEAEGRRLSAMVDQVMEFAQTESGRQQYRLQPLQLETIVDRALAIVFPTREEAAERVHSTIDPALPAALGDQTALTHSVANLIENAIKYGRTGGDVQLEARLDLESDRLCLSVINTGPAIPTSDLPHIFEPFYRGSNVGQTAGSGLGLSLARKMIRRQHGEVTVESQPEAGTTFTLHLRIARAPDSPESEEGARP